MTKDDILNASIKIISKDGFDKLTLSYLADALKVKKSSIYYHFVSKDEIILSLYSNAKKFSQGLYLMLISPIPQKKY